MSKTSTKSLLIKFNSSVHDLNDLENTLRNFLDILFVLEYEPEEEEEEDYQQQQLSKKTPLSEMENVENILDFPMVRLNIYIDKIESSKKTRSMTLMSLQKTMSNYIQLKKNELSNTNEFKSRKADPTTCVLRQMHIFEVTNKRLGERVSTNYESRETLRIWTGGFSIRNCKSGNFVEIIDYMEKPWENFSNFTAVRPWEFTPNLSNESKKNELILCITSGTIISPKDLEDMFANYKSGEVVFFSPYLRYKSQRYVEHNRLRDQDSTQVERSNFFVLVEFLISLTKSFWKVLYISLLYFWYQLVSCTCALCNFRSDVFYCGKMVEFERKCQKEDLTSGNPRVFLRMNFKHLRERGEGITRSHEASPDNGIFFEASKYLKSQAFIITNLWKGSKMNYLYAILTYLHWVKFVKWQNGQSKGAEFLVWNDWISFATLLFLAESFMRIITFLNTRQINVIAENVSHKKVIYCSKIILDVIISLLSPYTVFPTSVALWFFRNVFNSRGTLYRNCELMACNFGDFCKSWLCCCCRRKRSGGGGRVKSTKTKQNSDDEANSDDFSDDSIYGTEMNSQFSEPKKSYLTKFL